MISYTTQEQDQTLRKASQTWGQSFQKDMAQEECAELILVLNHYKRKRTDIVAVLEEVADTLVICRQLMLDHESDAGIPKGMSAEDFVIFMMGKKLERLARRIERNDRNSE